MAEVSVCPRCGFAGPENARYCAGCGWAFLPARPRLADRIEPLWRFPASLLSLAAILAISILTGWLIVDIGLYLPASYILLSLGIGLGGAYLGWQWDEPPSNRQRLQQVWIAFVVMGVFLAVLYGVDRTVLSWLAGTNQRIALNIPGLHAEAFQGSMRLIVVDAPPYGLLALGAMALASVAGHALHKALKSKCARRRAASPSSQRL